MAEKKRFRFGRIGLPSEALPTPKELYNAIDDTFRVREKKVVVEGEDPVELEEKGMNPYYSDGHGEYSFCQFTYISDKDDSATVKDGNQLKVAPDGQPVNPLVFYFKNGQFAYEPQQGLRKHWVPQFILECTNTAGNINDSFQQFSQQTMEEFYDECSEISLMKFSSTDKNLQDSSDTARALNELAEEIGSQEFSGGNPPVNLKGLEIFTEAVDKMFVSRLKGEDNSGYTTEILSTGMKQIKWDENDWSVDAGQQKRAETMYRRLAPYLRKIK